MKTYLYRWKPKRAVDCGKPDVRIYHQSIITFYHASSLPYLIHSSQPCRGVYLRPKGLGCRSSQSLDICHMWCVRSRFRCMQDVEISMLEVGYELGDDRVLLWLPWIGKHVINENSPLSNWLTPSGFMADADACIAVVASPSMILDCLLQPLTASPCFCWVSLSCASISLQHPSSLSVHVRGQDAGCSALKGRRLTGFHTGCVCRQRHTCTQTRRIG